MPFTPEELEEMEKADQEIEESFVLTNEEIAMAREYDKRAKYEAMTGDKQKVAAYQKAWYEANREKIAARNKAWYEANPKGKEVKPTERETVRRLEQALDGALYDIQQAGTDDFRRLKMGEYRGLKIAAAVLGLVIRETEGRHMLTEAAERKNESHLIEE